MPYSKYQQATINHVCKVFSYQDAYLVADEVGLGKTYVAKGIIQKLHQDNPQNTMRVIYIASNQVIARTNARDLGYLITEVAGSGGKMISYDRLSALGGQTVLPALPSVQIYAFSPNTTFTGRGSTYGNASEREQLANAAPAQCQAAAKLVSSYSPATGRTQEMAAAVAELRKEFNDEAVAKINPDLIILDEFHRFHTILSPVEQQGGYSFCRMIRKLNQRRDEKGLPHVKILLLSATPYKYNPKAEETVHTYEKDEQQSGDKDPTTAFDDFLTLKQYICDLNQDSGLGSSAVGDTQQDYFDHILCRTQRNWLCPADQGTIFQDVTTHWEAGHLLPNDRQTALWRHLAYSSEALSRVPQIGSPEQSSGDGRFGTLRSYLDEAPEYPQFADGYRSIQLSKKDLSTPISSSESPDRRDQIRNAYCQKLQENGRYLLRKSPTDDAPDWAWFDKLHGHYKWEQLKQEILPDGCEYHLWATPITLNSQNEYAKTVVFAHYRLSTRAIAVLVSMEVERRLSRVSGGQLLPSVQLDDSLWDCLLTPFRNFLGDLSDYTDALKSAILVFFNTTHARRVLTAFAISKGLSLASSTEIVRQYCEDYNWTQMILEYLECIFKFEAPGQKDSAPLEKQKISGAVRDICSVLDWEDRDFTRVLVLPDWKDSGYPCSFGERYTPDYSDKSAHDDSEKSDKQNTVRRLEYIRDRFQSPFYPFVLAASETAQEGVNLHNYCRTIVHWSVPSNLNSLVQEEGRVNRRGSWIQRKQMAYLLRHVRDPFLKISWRKGWHAVFNEKTAAAICESSGLLLAPYQGGLFPLWYLPMPEEKNVPRLHRMLLCLPLSGEPQEYEELFFSEQEYSTFGTRADERITGQLCPYLNYVPLPLFHGTNRYSLSLPDLQRRELYLAEDCVIPYIRANETALRNLRDQCSNSDFHNAFLIWEALSRGSANFEYHALYLTLSRKKAEEYAAASYPCGERSFCISQLLLAIQQLPDSEPPADETQAKAVRQLLHALQESKTAEKVILTYNMVPMVKIQAREDGGQDVDAAMRLALADPEYAQDSFRADGSVFQTFSDVSVLPG